MKRLLLATLPCSSAFCAQQTCGLLVYGGTGGVINAVSGEPEPDTL